MSRRTRSGERRTHPGSSKEGLDARTRARSSSHFSNQSIMSSISRRSGAVRLRGIASPLVFQQTTYGEQRCHIDALALPGTQQFIKLDRELLSIRFRYGDDMPLDLRWHSLREMAHVDDLKAMELHVVELG